MQNFFSLFLKCLKIFAFQLILVLSIELICNLFSSSTSSEMFTIIDISKHWLTYCSKLLYRHIWYFNLNCPLEVWTLMFFNFVLYSGFSCSNQESTKFSEMFVRQYSSTPYFIRPFNSFESSFTGEFFVDIININIAVLLIVL